MLGTVQLASSHLLTTCATLAALATFVSIGSNILPQSLVAGSGGGGAPAGLTAAFILNVAVILFGWRRAKDLRVALAASTQAEDAAFASAYLDHTTGLGNRRELARVLELQLTGSKPRGALLFLDLDHFKKVNDLYGHAAGDALLSFVARTLEEVAPRGSCCTRLGGDEFAVLFTDCPVDEVSQKTQSILNRLSTPLELQGFTAHISASVGLSLVSPLVGGAEAVMRRSDIAMYEAKRRGRNTFVWFDIAMEQKLQNRNAIESEMRDGIVNGEFVPFFQPLISLSTGELKGFEVLARWLSPSRGTVGPVDFIDVAEATGLIAPLSLNVMQQALIEARSWPGDLTIAVNVSPVQFRDPQLAHRIVKLLAETGFPAQRLEIEITESSLMEDHETALATVESLKNVGIRISLDDFGTGYASLTQLKALPFDRIKIDKSFVTALLTDKQSNAIVTTIADLGKSLKLPITAEGIETEGVRDLLTAMGCSDGQGWLFGKAMPAGEIRELLKTDGGFAAAVPLLVHAVTAVTLLKDRRDQSRRAVRRRPNAA